MARIKSIPYNERPSFIKDPYKKYFFGLEGVETEVRYLTELIKTYKPNLSKVFYFYSDKKTPTNHPKKIAEMLETIIEGTSGISLIYQSVPNVILEVLNENNVLVSLYDIESIVQSYASSIGKKSNEEITIAEIPGLVSRINRSLKSKGIYEMISEMDIQNIISSITLYDKSIDELIIIGDRDKKTFTDDQYDYVLDFANKNNVKLYITNPCIEFWFLLHHTDALSLDKINILENKNDYIYKELKKYDSKYSKRIINSSYYISSMSVALKNVSNYCTDIENIKNEVGSNLGELYELLTK